MWLWNVQLLEDRTDTGLCVPLWSIRLELPIIDEARNETHILQAQVCDGISTKNETGN